MPIKRTANRTTKSTKRASTLKAKTPAKKSGRSSAKTSGLSAQVRTLESCLAADHAKLQKIYPKVLTDMDKAIARKSQELKKAKAKGKSAKGTKGRSAKTAGLTSLEKALDALKVEKSSLQSDHKKFTALHKANQKVEKSWAKNAAKLTKKTKPKSQRRSLRKAPANESGSVFQESF